jgi:hypothetical protein
MLKEIISEHSDGFDDWLLEYDQCEDTYVITRADEAFRYQKTISLFGDCYSVVCSQAPLH